jgi:uncharacterized protein YaiI (UPF0178 family)
MGLRSIVVTLPVAEPMSPCLGVDAYLQRSENPEDHAPAIGAHYELFHGFCRCLILQLMLQRVQRRISLRLINIGSNNIARAGDTNMARIDSALGPGNSDLAALGHQTDLAQLGTIPNNGNLDQGVSAVQGKGRDGRVYTGQLIQRIYGTGYVRFYLKGTGHSHPLPARITSSDEAKVFARQQIGKGVWRDLPLGDQNAFKPNAASQPSSTVPVPRPAPPPASSTVTASERLGTIPKAGNVDQGLGLIQGRTPDGKVYKGELIQRVYGTGQVRFYLKGSGRSHSLPAAITSSENARVYARQQIAAGRWKDMQPGDQNAFSRRSSTDSPSVSPGGKAPNVSAPSATSLPTEVVVDLGNPRPKMIFDISGPPENAVARNRARDAGLKLEKDERSMRIPNTREGGKIFAQMQFQTSGVNDNCNVDCRVVGAANGRLPMPSNMSPQFVEGYKAGALKPNVD